MSLSSQQRLSTRLKHDILRVIDSRHSVILLLYSTCQPSLIPQSIRSSALQTLYQFWNQDYSAGLVSVLSYILKAVCLCRRLQVFTSQSGSGYTSGFRPVAVTLFSMHIPQRHDDSQLYVSFRTESPDDLYIVKSKLQVCQRHWYLDVGLLKLDQDQSEQLVFTSKFRVAHEMDSVAVVNELITPEPRARNLGIILDTHLSFNYHMAHVCKTSHFHLRNISKIRNSLQRSRRKS